MKRLLLLFSTIVLSFNTYSQNSARKNGEMILVTKTNEVQPGYSNNKRDQWDKWEEKSRKPMGKNVTVTYDKFFKNYKINYTNSDNISMAMVFEYINETAGGMNKVYSCSGKYYSCFDFSLETGADYWVYGITFDQISQADGYSNKTGTVIEINFPRPKNLGNKK
jgi:hypothetical protein